METPETPMEELLAGYAMNDDFTASELKLIEAYLADHPEQQQELRSLQNTLSLVPFYLPESFASEQIRDRLVSSVPRTPWLQWLSRGSIALAVLSLTIGSVLMGWHGYQARRQVADFQQSLEMPDNRLLSFKPMDHFPSSSGSLVIVPNNAKGLLVIQNLATPPKGKMYFLWLSSAQGKMMFCGKFVPNTGGKVVMYIPIDRQMIQAQEALITLETMDDPVQHPTGTRVLRASST